MITKVQNGKYKVLLVAMPNVHVGINEVISVPNLGIASIAGNLKNCDFRTLDLVLVKSDIEKYLFKIIDQYSPNLVGLSCMSFQYGTAIQIAKLIKTWKPNIKIAIGGYHPTLVGENIEKSPDMSFLDFVVRKEGEISFNSIVQAIQQDDDFQNIPNISFKRNGEIIHTQTQTTINLEDIDLPDRTHRIIDKFKVGFKKSDSLETSRGCVMPCSFCSIRKMYGKSLRKYPIERVISDLKINQELGVKYIFVVDDNITLDVNRFMNLCDEIKSNKLNNINYFVQASSKGIASNPELAKKMAEAGFVGVFLGIENASKKNLEYFSKGEDTLEESRQAVAYLRENKLGVLGGFILGNPNDDEEAFWDNFKFSKELKVDGPLYFVTTPHYGTELREDLLNQNLVTNEVDFSWYNGGHANIKTNHLSSDEIDRLVLKMYSKFNDIDAIKDGFMWRRHVLYFFLRAAKYLSKDLLRAMIRILKNEKDPLIRARINDVKRRKRWLLDTDSDRLNRLFENVN